MKCFIFYFYRKDEISSDESTELLLLMQQKLPKYLIKCFRASGFDTEEVITLWT